MMFVLVFLISTLMFMYIFLIYTTTQKFKRNRIRLSFMVKLFVPLYILKTHIKIANKLSGSFKGKIKIILMLVLNYGVSVIILSEMFVGSSILVKKKENVGQRTFSKIKESLDFQGAIVNVNKGFAI